MYHVTTSWRSQRGKNKKSTGRKLQIPSEVQMPHYSDLQSWLGGMIEILALGFLVST